MDKKTSEMWCKKILEWGKEYRSKPIVIRDRYMVYDLQQEQYRGENTRGGEPYKYSTLMDIEGDLYDFHSVDCGGLDSQEEFDSINLIDMCRIFGWEIRDLKGNTITLSIGKNGKYKLNK
jgi:hypothetical protein